MDTIFKESLVQLRSRWEESMSNPNALTSEAKKQCLQELNAIYNSLGNIRNQLAKASEDEERNEISDKIQRSTARLAEINDALRRMGVLSMKVRLPSGVNYCEDRFWGEIPSNWVDRDEYLKTIESFKADLVKLEADFAYWKPALMPPRRDYLGNWVESPVVMPPPTEFLKAWLSKLRDPNDYNNDVRHNFRKLIGEIQAKRGSLHHLLSNCKPVDMQKLRDNMDRLNAEKEQIVFELRVLECKGHSVDLGPIPGPAI